LVPRSEWRARQAQRSTSEGARSVLATQSVNLLLYVLHCFRHAPTSGPLLAAGVSVWFPQRYVREAAAQDSQYSPGR
ncbi:MAG: hypothetical protein ABW034_03760, partial [Steroidobacteraceae bacterium]